MKVAIITGIAGQDGSLLARKLLDLDYQVLGSTQRSGSALWRLEVLGIKNRIKLIPSIQDKNILFEILRRESPSEIYNLSGFSSTVMSYSQPEVTNFKIIRNLELLLEGVSKVNREVRIFTAGSSEIFETVSEKVLLNETSTVGPSNPYGFAHVAAKSICEEYRKIDGLQIFYGIFFNHESWLRDDWFLTRKLLNGFEAMSKGWNSPISIGNFESAKDWGIAHEFVNAVYELTSKGKPGNYVFATGVLSKVEDLVREFAIAFGFNPIFENLDNDRKCIDQVSRKVLVQIDPMFARSNQEFERLGDASKLNNETSILFTKGATNFVRQFMKHARSKN